MAIEEDFLLSDEETPDTTSKPDLPGASPVPCKKKWVGPDGCVGCSSPDCPQRASYLLRKQADDCFCSICQWTGVVFLMLLLAGGVVASIYYAQQQSQTCLGIWLGEWCAWGVWIFTLAWSARHYGRTVWTGQGDVIASVINMILFVVSLCAAIVLLFFGIGCLDPRTPNDVVSTGAVPRYLA